MVNREIWIVLFFIRMFSSVGFGILYSSLTLFLIENLHVQKSIAISIVGIFISLHYALALLTGIVTGRWISYINALIIGILLQALSIVLVYGSIKTIFLGCSLFLVGSLSGATSINMIITERFEAQDPEREKLFMWNYAAMNLGNILGFSIAGYFQLINNFKNVSNIAIILMLVALVLCIIYKNKLNDVHSHYVKFTLRQRWFSGASFILILLLLTLLIREIFTYSSISSTILVIVISITLFLFLTFNCKNNNRKSGIIFMILAISYLLFWSLYFLIPTGLMLFANFNVTDKLFGVQIPPEWLPNINSILVILGAPLLSGLFKNLNEKHNWTTIDKFIVGLLSLSFAFFLLIIGIVIARFKLVPLGWLVFTYVFLTFAELFIAPVGFAAIGKYVIRKNQGVMTGVWLSILGLGGLIASKLSNFVRITGTSILESNKQFLVLFIGLFVLAIIFSLILYLFRILPYFKRI